MGFSNLINDMKSKNHHKRLFSRYAIRFLTAPSSLRTDRDLVTIRLGLHQFASVVKDKTEILLNQNIS